jgi:virulence-associated protein VapD
MVSRGGFSETSRRPYSAGKSGIGHNSGGSGRMYAVVFDLDTEMLKQVYPGNAYNQAYQDIRVFLTARGFIWKQGSTYFGDDTIDAVRCVRVVQRLAAKFNWFTPSVRDIRMLRIEENNDLMIAIDDRDDV